MIALVSSFGFWLTLACLIVTGYVFGLVAFMKEKAQIHTAFLLLLGATFLWILGALILLAANLVGVKETWLWAVDLAYVGLILVPVAVLYLGLVFARTRIQFSWKHALLFVVPVASIAMVFTNPLHHLFYRTVEFATLTDFASLGPYFLFHTAYSYVCIMVGGAFLVVFSVKNAGFFSRQSILTIVSLLISIVYNVLLTLQVIDVPFHTNAFPFLLSTLLFYVAILRFDFLSIVPVALQRVVDHISDSFLVLDKNRRIIDFNRTFTDTFGGVCAVSRKLTLEQVAANERCQTEFGSLLLEVAQIVNERREASFERALTIDGKELYFSVEVSILTTPGDVLLSTIVLLKDVTELKRAMDEVARSTETLMERERLASLGQMVGGIAHNLKTPIMSIAGAAEGLKDLVKEYDESVDDPKVTKADHHEIAAEMRTWIDKITPHTAYMSDIISTVKDQVSVATDKTVMTFALDELLKRVDLLMKHELKQYHCELAVDRRTSRDVRIRGDITGLVQVFDNLILNAIHSYEGASGRIDLEIREEGPNLLFAVADHGKGIPPSVQERLFKEMVTTKGKGGTGLGLYISATTIRVRFGGRIWFESEVGRGTTFHVQIPAVPMPGAAPEPAPQGGAS